MTHRILAPRLAALCLAAALLAACAAVPQQTPLGSPRQDVLQRMGPPTATWPLPAGTRLQYSYGPYGRQVYNIDLDAADQVSAVTQALEPGSLYRVAAMTGMTGTDIQRELGAPSLVEKVGRFDGDVWTWRFWEIGTPRLFHAYIDKQGRVERMLTTDEPIRPWRGGD